MADLKELSSRFLADRYHLMAFISGLVRDPEAAEDIFQEVWIRLAGAAESGQRIEHPPAWCRGVARNLILRRWREARGAKIVADSELIDFVDQAFEEQASDGERWRARREALVACVKGLPKRSRKVLRLKYDRGLPATAVAEATRRSVKSVFMLLSRLRRSLAECVEKKLRLAGS